MSRTQTGEPRSRMLITVLAALILAVMPLPWWLDAARPAFLVMTVLYWSIAAPRAGGLALGFAAGLMLDVFKGAVLGQHALALTLVTYIGVREHQKIRSKPLFQQALIILLALVAYEGVVFAIDGWTGQPIASALRWIHPLTSAIIWPIAAVILERSHAPR